MNLSDASNIAFAAGNGLQLPLQDISVETLLEKYAKGDESTVAQVHARVATALAEVEEPDHRGHYQNEFLWALQNGFVPAGRISSAAGTGLQTTLIVTVHPATERSPRKA